MWKIKAFIDMVKSIDCSLVTNIVCVGDSFIEIEAAKALASKFNQAYIKCVKFWEVPKPEELDKQLVLFWGEFRKNIFTSEEFKYLCRKTREAYLNETKKAVSLFYYLYIHSKILFLSMSNK